MWNITRAFSGISSVCTQQTGRIQLVCLWNVPNYRLNYHFSITPYISNNYIWLNYAAIWKHSSHHHPNPSTNTECACLLVFPGLCVCLRHASLRTACYYSTALCVKGKAIPFTGLDRPWGFQDVEAPRFQDNRHIKVVGLSALRTGRLYILPGTHFY